MYCSSNRKAFTRPKHGCQPEAEVEEFVKGQRSKCIAVTAELIQAKAKEMERFRGIPHMDFEASRGRAERFMTLDCYSAHFIFSQMQVT